MFIKSSQFLTVNVFIQLRPFSDYLQSVEGLCNGVMSVNSEQTALRQLLFILQLSGFQRYLPSEEHHLSVLW